ncbi:uncharacterized protein LOC129719113 isoform X2 [Wyeomyia smithii]|uniref:uncharacterized protein LOC129719113 isoform X2 n=1 Tax=Wyeomyia smithii TaxID=174621 RepID=UPI002467DD15|nr:uncharacterized protein LOC129719113 isoform X2 [Wyeomyia smithii]
MASETLVSVPVFDKTIKPQEECGAPIQCLDIIPVSERGVEAPSPVSVPSVEKATRLQEECGVSIQCLDIIGVFRHCNGKEYIKKKFPTEMRIDQLGFSARLCHANLNIKLQHEGCLMTADDHFVAKIRIENPQSILQAVDFGEAKSNLLQQLRIVKILQDDLTNERVAGQSSVVKTIENHFRQTLEVKNSSENIQLYLTISTHCDGLTDFNKFCEAISENEIISTEIRSAAASYLKAEARGIVRDKILAQFSHHQSMINSTEVFDQLAEIGDEYVRAYRRKLLDLGPMCLRIHLSGCVDNRIIFVHEEDVNLFYDIAVDLNEKTFLIPLANFAARWMKSLKTSANKLLPVKRLIKTNFHHLANSLRQLIFEISDNTDHKVEELLISDDPSGWYPLEKITWKSEDVLTKCLEQEYFLIFKLLKHYDVDCDSEKQFFELTEERKQHLTWKQLAKSIKPHLDDETEDGNNPTRIPEEKYIWFYLLGDILFHTLPAEYEFDCFEAIIEDYVDFMLRASPEQMEMLRVITHSTARFMVQSMTFLAQKDYSPIDHQSLQIQLSLINAKSINSSLIPSSFRDLVNEFNIYWKHREDIITGIPFKICLPEMESVKKALLEIILVALDKTIAPEVLQSFLKSFAELLLDLNKVQLDWYVKAFPGLSMTMLEELKLIEVIDNELAKTEYKTYRVLEVEKFTKAASVLLESVSQPKHYVIELLLILLSFVNNQLTKVQWKSGDKLSEVEQIVTTQELIGAVRNCFLCLREQTVYKSFELFLDERIKPLANAVKNSGSQADFTEQIARTKRSRPRRNRNQNGIGIDQALKLFGELNSASMIEDLRSAYREYDANFQLYIKDSHEDYIMEASRVANKVLETKFQKSFDSWIMNDKRKKIPKLLAGLAAVWSILASEPVAGTGKFLTPYCVQILCILTLLSVDRTTGVLNCS